VKINVDGIPKELHGLRQWVCWEKEIREGKETKIPYQSGTQTLASVDDPRTWTTLVYAVQSVKSGLHDGVGFIFTENDQYCGIDFDKCVDTETKEINQWALNKIQRLNSYTEYSQSGLGIHVIVKAKIPEHIKAGNKTGRKDTERGFEIYDQGRFFCTTGNILQGYPLTIEERQEQVNQICEEIFGKSEQKEPTKRQLSTITLSDQEIIEKLNNAKNSDKFKKLFYNGDCSDYPKPDGTPDQSSGDLALVDLIAFYTQDFSQIVSLMKQSALYDDKWDREDYQHRTINKALSNLTETYNPGGNHTTIDKSNKAGDPVAEIKEADAEQAEKQKKIDPSYFVDGTFIPKLLADELMNDYDFICVDGILYVYQNGVYMAIGDDYVETESYKRLGSKSRANRVIEVIKYIKAMSRTERSSLNTYIDLINLENGMLNYKTGKWLEHSKDYLSTIRIPVKYDPNVSNSVITDWLDSTLADAECIQLACELFGYCLIPDTTMAKAFMLVGSGANGKSTFLTVLENFIGKDNVSKVPLQELSDHRFKRADLFGKLVNLFADLDNRSLESTTYFKTIVTGDSIDAERKNQNPFSFKPFARLVFSANEIPRSRDRSFAYYRRWCIIPFDRQFIGADDKKGLANELSRPENLSALLNCALPELRRIFNRGSFSEPGKVKDALGEYEKQNDPVKAFVDECCELDPTSRIERGLLYDAFCRYCNEANFKTVTRNNFYQRLRIFREIREVMNSEGRRMFEGVKLIAN